MVLCERYKPLLVRRMLLKKVKRGGSISFLGRVCQIDEGSLKTKLVRSVKLEWDQCQLKYISSSSIKL